MKDWLKTRVLDEAKYILKYRSTVRAMTKVFGVCKSTIHHDLAHKLPHIDLKLYRRVNNLLKFNLSVRCIRGGQATKTKYKLRAKSGS